VNEREIVSRGTPKHLWLLVTLAGIVLGIVYALSPLTVWLALGMVPLVRWAGRDLKGDERRWVTAIILLAIGLRVLAVAGLFAATAHGKAPFGSFFGDEEYFIKRSIWMRNVALDLPVHGADLVYAYDEYSATSYLFVLALLQILVGPAPYGVHLFAIGLYLTATILLYRIVRRRLGRAPAFVGLIALLTLPSLFAWSVSALKESLFFFLTVCGIAWAAMLFRGPGWKRGAIAVVALIGLTAALETVRTGGAALSAAGVLGGGLLALLARRPRLLLATVVVIPIVVGATLNRPNVQLRAYRAVQAAAGQHWGHIATAGYVYHLLDERFYPDRAELFDLQLGDTMRFLVRALVSYITVPLPWDVQSPAALMYLPEQMVWYVLVALLPFGVVFALRRDAIVAGLLVAHAAVAAVSVALTGGNVGTLVRHRGLAIPYIVWLSAVGGCELVVRWHARSHPVHVPPSFPQVAASCP
jgi:hypothetical protein